MINLKRKHKKNTLLILPFGSLVACLPFIFYPTGWISLVALIPLLWYLKIKFDAHDTTHIVMTLWLFGFFYLLIVCGWLINADAHSWTQLGGMSLQYLIFIMWFLLGLFLSIGFLVFGLVTRLAITKRVPFYKYLIMFPFLWVASEFGRSWLFSVIAYGKNATVGPFYNFGVLGYSLSSTELLRFSRIGGLFGLSFLIVIVNTVIVLVLLRKFKPALWLLLPVVLLGIAACIPISATKKVPVATVQLASDDKDYYDDLAKKIPVTNVPRQVMVLPEYSYFFDYGTPAQHSSITTKLFQDNDGVIIYSRKGTAKDGLQTNEMVVASPNGDTIDTQLKSFLIPTGEYIPWIVQQGLQHSGQKKVQGYFDASLGIAKADHVEHVIKGDSLQIGALVCSGVIAPDRYRTLTNQGAELLTNSASLNEFTNTPLYHLQARQFARFIAVANDRPFVQSARGGYSYIIDHNGTTLFDSHTAGIKIGQATVGSPSYKTIYTRLGEWVGWLSAIVTIGYVVFLMYRHRPKI